MNTVNTPITQSVAMEIMITKVSMGSQSFYVIDTKGQKRQYGTGGTMNPGETLVVTSTNQWATGPYLSGKVNGAWTEQVICNQNGALTRYFTPTVIWHNGDNSSYQIAV